MPAVYAHKRFGERIFEFLPADLKQAFTPYKDCFMLGLEGPDIFFYHRPYKPNETQNRARQLHLNSAKDFFLSAANKITAQETDKPEATAIAAYTAGFICHFTLDNACHPRVYKLEDTGVSHGRIESEFDKYILRKEGKQVFGNNPAKHFKATKETISSASKILDAKEVEIRRAVRMIKLVNGIFTSRFGFVHTFVLFLLKKLGLEKRYGGMLLHHTDDEACSAINADLYRDLENAIPQGLENITIFFKHLKTTAQTSVIDNIFDKDYRGGIIHE